MFKYSFLNFIERRRSIIIINTTIGGDYEDFAIVEYGNILALKRTGIPKKIIPLHKGTIDRYQIIRTDTNEVDLQLYLKNGTFTNCMMDQRTFIRFQNILTHDVSIITTTIDPSPTKKNTKRAYSSVNTIPVFLAATLLIGLLYFILIHR